MPTEEEKAADEATAAVAAEEKEKATQIGTNSQGLFVFEYLNRRLMIRKAVIARQKKAEQQSIFARAARVGA
nr:telomerase elongation inhibitor [Melanopsichium pennsylvanicum 4]